MAVGFTVAPHRGANLEFHSRAYLESKAIRKTNHINELLESEKYFYDTYGDGAGRSGGLELQLPVPRCIESCQGILHLLLDFGQFPGYLGDREVVLHCLISDERVARSHLFRGIQSFHNSRKLFQGEAPTAWRSRRHQHGGSRVGGVTTSHRRYLPPETASSWLRVHRPP